MEGPTLAQPAPAEPPSSIEAGRRRFAWASVVAVAGTAVPLVWIFWNLEQTADADSGPIHENNFYELQARAMFHGHLWLANGSLGIEAFIHAGRQYTYFGLFPSLVRMPILLFTSSLDGKLTDPYIFAAWLLTALFASLLLWRVRMLVRGPASMGWAETVSYGILLATILGGSVFMILASEPDVFQEDLAWSICLTVGSLFALLGVMERPSRARVIVAFVFIFCANLDRVTTGLACVGAAILIAGWFWLARGGEQRRWALPMLGVGLVPLVVGCAVNYAKFGVPIGVSNFDQVFTHVNAYRRKFLAANHNAEYGTAFLPTTLLAYLRPDGIRFTDVFPFITLPAVPPRALGGVLFDRRYRTASLPSSMPLLFLLSCWGVITSYRPKSVGRAALARIPLLASALAAAALFVWGYIAPRYLADFVPFLVVASAVAMADIWRRLATRPRPRRVTVLAVIGVLGLFSIVANVAMSVTPNEEWNTNEVRHYVAVQKAISDVTGHPLNADVRRGSSLPGWAPADQLYVVGDCNGLYLSNGEDFSTVPEQQYQRDTWMAVERGHTFQHTYEVTVNTPPGGVTTSRRLVVAGSYTVLVGVAPTSDPKQLELMVGPYGKNHQVYGIADLVAPGSHHRVVVVTDPAKHLVEATVDGSIYLDANLSTTGPISNAGSGRSAGPIPALVVKDRTASTPGPTICQSLVGSG
jgi:hypothetical protein